MNDSSISSLDKTRVPAASNLSHWSSFDWTNGVQVNEMNELDSLTVQTQNSVYEITVLTPHIGEVLVRGGQFFPDWTPASLSGASFGGSFLKLHGVYVDFKMEFLYDGQRIVTSRVCSIVSGTN